MNISRISNYLCPIFLACAFMQLPYAGAAEDGYERTKFIEVGLGYEYSDNVYKSSDDKKGSSTPKGDLSLGYTQKKGNNQIAVNYFAEYANESDNDLDNSSYWIGTAFVQQEVFTENLLFNLSHSRQRFLVDESQPDLDENQDERDLLNVGLQWFIPYSPRSTFILGASHSESWFNGGTSSDSHSNQGSAAWQYTMSDKTQLELSYTGSKNEFDDFDNSYKEHNVDARVTRQYLLGTYSIHFGESWVDGSNDNYNGEHYGFIIDALIRSHLLTFDASRELMNSSEQLGETDELDFTENQLFWRTRISLEHRYAMLDDRLISKLRLYFVNDDEIATIESDDARDKDRYGISGKLNWKLTEQFSTSLSAHHYKADLSTGGDKDFTNLEASARYNILKSLYLQFSVIHEEQGDTPEDDGFNEQRYVSRIAFRY